MEEYYSETPISNSKILCVGAITQKEAELAGQDAPFCDGFGYYLYIVDSANPKSGAQVLAKVASEEAAQNLSRLLSSRG